MLMHRKMHIVQVLNNNVVIASNGEGAEVVALGKGLGFHARKGQKLDEHKIEKTYICADEKQIEDLLSQVSPLAFEAAGKVCAYAQEQLGCTISANLYLMLADHISFAVERARQGMNLTAPFLVDLQELYSAEYKIGVYAKKCTEELFGISLAEDEAGFICMHFVAMGSQEETPKVKKMIAVTTTALDYIFENYPHSLPKGSIAYRRLVTHIKFFAQRYLDNEEDEITDGELIDTVGRTFPEESACIDSLSAKLFEMFGREVFPSEKSYMVLHLRNCLRDQKE